VGLETDVSKRFYQNLSRCHLCGGRAAYLTTWKTHDESAFDPKEKGPSPDQIERIRKMEIKRIGSQESWGL